MDILVPHEERPTGFLAETAEDFAQKIEKIFALKPQERIELQAWVYQKRGLWRETLKLEISILLKYRNII